VQSTEFGETADLSLEALSGPPRKHWSDFVRGVAAVLQGAGIRLSGANLIIKGQVPMGAGLSSSASLEVATALALLDVAKSHLPPRDVALLCQRAEHEYVGTRCGIMDQFISVFAQSAHALMLDCRSLQSETLTIPADARLVICNSMVKHELAGGEYNRRRADCETGVRILNRNLPHVRALRDSCRELDLLVEIASGCGGVYGSRMTGGGFGGCTITLARADAVDAFRNEISKRYRNETSIIPDIYVCSAAQGAGPWEQS